MLAPEELHVTICYSKKAMVWGSVPAAPDEITIEATTDKRGEPVRQMEKFGREHDVLVLQIESDQLSDRWQEFRDHGASYDFPDYKPHITITYSGKDVDETAIEPYRGEIVLGEEIFKEIEKDWDGDAATVDLTESAIFEAKMEVIDGIRVWVDPTAGQLSQLCDRGELRGIADANHAYVWQSGHAIHMDMIKRLGLDMKSYATRFYAFLPDFGETERDWSRYGDTGNRGQQLRSGVVISAKQHAFEALKRVPCIGRWFAPRVGQEPVLEAVEQIGEHRFFRNPSRGQINALMTHYGELRGSAFRGDIWVWDAHAPLHHVQAQRLLGIKSSEAIDFYITDQRPKGEGGFAPLAVGRFWVAADWTDMPRLSAMGVFRSMQGGREFMGEGVEMHNGVKYWRNPTQSQWSNLLVSSDLRGLISGQDVYVWQASSEIHFRAAADLGLAAPYDEEDEDAEDFTPTVPFYAFVGHGDDDSWEWQVGQSGRVDVGVKKTVTVDRHLEGQALACRRFVALARGTRLIAEATEDALPRKFWLAFDVPCGKTYNEEDVARTEKKLRDIGAGELDGVQGISDTREIATNWFLMCRNALLVMEPARVAELNDIERIRYDDPEYLCRNNMLALYRLWDKAAKGKQEANHAGLFHNVLDYFLEKLDDVLDVANLKYNIRNNGSYFKLQKQYAAEKPSINSVADFAAMMFRYLSEPTDGWSGRDRETAEEIRRHERRFPEIARLTLLRIGTIYADEGEWSLARGHLTVPPNSILMIGVEPEIARTFAAWKADPTQGIPFGEWRYRNYEALVAAIEKYQLRTRYALRFVDATKFERIRTDVISRRRNSSR